MSLVRKTQFVPFLFVSLFLLLLLAACRPVVEQAAAAPVPTRAPLATVEAAPSLVAEAMAEPAEAAQAEAAGPSLPTASPEEVVTAFYTWYLAYIGSPASDTFRNPLVDGAYRQSELLSPAFIAEVDELLASFEGGGYDPFLLAQDIPQSFYVESGPTAESALAYLQFGDNFHPRLVTCMEIDGRWLITGIAEAEQEAATSAEVTGPEPASDGVTFVDDEYGYSFQLPAGWVANELNLQGPGMPDDWPVVRGFQLMPEAIAAAQAAQSGPPDPEAEPIIPPINMSVLQGDQAAFDRVFVPADSSETASYNGLELQLQRQGEAYTIVRYVLRHPLDSTLWLVFEDVVSEFPGREAQAEAIAGVLPGLLSTLSFTQ